MHRLRPVAGLLAGVLLAAPAGPAEAAQSPPATPAAAEVARLRDELDALRLEYGRRVAALEERLAALEGRSAPGAPEAAPAEA
ncbi:MAG TPA: hypothetical protein VGB87_19275, partial [Vicinamibacteria bacterium]